VLYTNSTLDRERTGAFTLSVRVQLSAVPTRLVSVRIDVTVDDVNDWPPQFTFPIPGNQRRRKQPLC